MALRPKEKRRRRSGAPKPSQAPPQHLVVEGIELVPHGGAISKVLEGEHAGMKFFVRHLLPGEVAKVRVMKLRRGYGEGRIEELLSESPSRIPFDCSVAKLCGGCSWRHVPAEQQSAARGGFARKAVQRVWPNETLQFELRAPEVSLRSRARFLLSSKGLAYRSFRGREPVVPDKCPALHSQIDDQRDELGQYLLSAGLVGASVLVVRGIETGTGKWKLFVNILVTNSRELDFSALELSSQFTEGLGAVRVQNPRGETLWMHGDTGFGWPLKIGNARRNITFSLGAFTQVSPEGNQVLVEALWSLVSELEPQPEKVLELFAGAGNLSVAWPSALTRLTVVERDNSALENLQSNLGTPQPFELRQCCGDLSRGLLEIVRAEPGEFDVVLLDPPREGASAMMPDLVELRSPWIIYVSCDPATLSRDLEVLRDGGYMPTRVIAVELFQATPHIETLVVMRRQS